ncbi:MAG TPA: hypothetical protein VJ725_30940 [Thermoanaerobaculia bacterium]|nr:hypothetical protein [Thermoanaerobaculia bacterium]
MAKPGSVEGPIRIKPNKKSDLVDFRRAKLLQDFINATMSDEQRRIAALYPPNLTLITPPED